MFEKLIYIKKNGETLTFDNYLIDENGTINSVDYKQTKKNVALTPNYFKKYPLIHLRKNNKHYMLLIHRAVLSTFKGNEWFEGAEVNHKNHNTNNFHLSNLEWVSRENNIRHSYLPKKIAQFDKNGLFIKEWDSIRKAAKALNLKESLISNVVAGKKHTTGGYIFKSL